MGGFEMDNFDWIEREEKYDQLFDGMYDFEFDDFKKCI